MDKIYASSHHFKLRWIGAPLLCSGLLLLLQMLHFIRLGHPSWLLLLAAISSALALTSFGINHDTGVALAVEAEQEGASFEEHRLLEQELAEDMGYNSERTLELKPHRALSHLIPFVTCVIQLYLWRFIVSVF
jgi:hypothetical protein